MVIWDFSVPQNENNICTLPFYGLPLELTGKTIYAGYSYKFSLKIHGETIAAKNSFFGIVDVKNKLIQAKLATINAQYACVMEGPGNYGGYSYKHRISISGNILMGVNSLDSAMQKINELKQESFCY